MIGTCFDENKTFHWKLQNEISALKSENSILMQKISENNIVHETLSELKSRSMQQDLLFFGIAEPPTGRERDNIKPKLKDFMKNELDLDNPSMVDSIVLDRVHRVRQPKQPPDANPRPVVVQFERYIVNLSGRLRGLNVKPNGFSIREHHPTPPHTHTHTHTHTHKHRNGGQTKVTVSYHAANVTNSQNHVVLVREKLYVNDDLYTVHTNEAGELT